jgi:hypothetical protein
MNKDEKFNLIGTDKMPFMGYNSSGDKTKLPSGFLIRGSKNVYKTLRGTIATRPGLKLRGSVDSTSAGVKSSFEWATSVGTFRALRVDNNKLQVESDIVTSGTYVWYDLLETSSLDSPAASLTRFVFDTWWDNDQKGDRLVMVRGDDKILHWSGGMALVDSATTNTITKQGTESWAELGFKSDNTVTGEKKIIIDGREFTYTGGESTTTLTGVTASSGTVESLTSGMVAIQSVMVGDNKPIDGFKADFCKTIGNQLWVGSYSSRVVWISADSTASSTLGILKFTQTGTLVTGDPDAVIMDSPGKGIATKDGKVILFAGNNEVYVITPNEALPITQATTLLTGGDTRAIIQKIEKKRLPALASALGHEFIDNLGEYLIWLDQKNRLRALGFFANIDSLKPINLSLPVQNELSEDDFTGGHLRVISDKDGDTVYMTAPNNARDWMYQVREKLDESGQVVTERLWQPPQIRGIQRFAVIGGSIYGHSNTYPQLYQIWDTNQYSDDHPSEEQVPFTARALFAYNNHGDSFKMKTFDMVPVEGYMLENNPLDCRVYYDYQGAEDTRDLIVNSEDEPASFWLGVYPPSIGDSSLGDNPLGDGILPEGGNQELVSKFRAILDVDQVNCFEYAIEFYSNEVDARWEILSFGTNAKLASQLPTHIRK